MCDKTVTRKHVTSMCKLCKSQYYIILQNNYALLFNNRNYICIQVKCFSILSYYLYEKKCKLLCIIFQIIEFVCVHMTIFLSYMIVSVCVVIFWYYIYDFCENVQTIKYQFASNYNLLFDICGAVISYPLHWGVLNVWQN